MKNRIKIICFVMILLVIPYKVYGSTIEESKYITHVKQDLLVLMLAYPEQIIDIEKDSNDSIYIVMKNGKKILYDDKKEKTYDQKFFNADLEDTLSDIYPLNMIDKVMDNNYDPGRIRNYGFLGAMYGESKSEIEKNLSSISTYYGTVMFSTVNKASEELKAALNDISNTLQRGSRDESYVAPLSGGYNYRHIQDTGLLSAHAYGISIDLNRNDSDYWKWVSKEEGSKRIASYPQAIVEAFENHGFVWGGKWAHFDILHFEYRPEIILKAKYFGGNKNVDLENWYGDIDVNENIEGIINLINKKLGE